MSGPSIFGLLRRSFGCARPVSNKALLRAVAGARILLAPSRIRQLSAAIEIRKHGRDHDPLFFLTHRYYLSQKLTMLQRIDCAIVHHVHEQRSRRADYHDLVYGSCGLELWRQQVGDTCCSLRLAATEDNPHEGDLSVLLVVDAVRVCRMSFSYVSAGIFGREPRITMFVTRNQTDRNDQLARFRAAFRQNSPPYFCLAALAGIAMADGLQSIYGVKHDAQIAYQERYRTSFENSYSGFWHKFNAEEVADHAYRLAIPLDLAPVSEVIHKARAVGRRAHWARIIHDSRRAIERFAVCRSSVEHDLEPDAFADAADGLPAIQTPGS